MLNEACQPIPRLAPGIEMKRRFRDAYERRSYSRAWLLGRRLLEEPALLGNGRDFLDRFVRTDPRQRQVYALWTDTLKLPVNELVARLLADDALGSALRETAPVFVVIPADEVRALARAVA